jgi:hypothetical protein
LVRTGKGLDKEGREEGSLEGMSEHTQEGIMWLVRIAEGIEESNLSFFYYGPFDNGESAYAWMNEYPDDKNVFDMDCFFLNSPVLKDGSPNH